MAQDGPYAFRWLPTQYRYPIEHHLVLLEDEGKPACDARPNPLGMQQHKEPLIPLCAYIEIAAKRKTEKAMPPVGPAGFQSLCDAILKNEKGVFVAFVFDSSGRFVSGKIRNGHERRFRLADDTLKLGVAKTTVALGASEMPGLNLGKMEYVMVGRTGYNSMTFALPLSEYSIGLTFSRNVNAPRLYARVVAMNARASKSRS